MKMQIRTVPDALDYLVDCTLATVSWMADLKGKSKSEYERQISIAQKGIDFIEYFSLEVDPNSRAFEVITYFNKSVKEWANQYDVALKNDKKKMQ